MQSCIHVPQNIQNSVRLIRTVQYKQSCSIRFIIGTFCALEYWNNMPETTRDSSDDACVRGSRICNLLTNTIDIGNKSFLILLTPD